MNNKQIKLENSARLEALRPTETLNRIGIHQNDTICDIGAGSGVFTLPAAAMTKKTVFALDMDEEMLAEIRKKAKNEGIQNIELIKVFDDHFAVPDNMIDIILMVTVLHEITNTGVFLEEAKRLLKRHGKIALIEFHKYTTKMGPPVQLRIGRDDAKKLFDKLGFGVVEEFDLGDDLYCLVFQTMDASSHQAL